MPATLKSVSAIGFAIILGACSQQAPTPVSSEPIYNKVGGVAGCRAADGTITEVNPNSIAGYGQRRNPCEPEQCVDGQDVTGANYPCLPPPEDCIDGYTAAQVPCRTPGEDNNGRPTGGGQPTGTPQTGPIN